MGSSQELCFGGSRVLCEAGVEGELLRSGTFSGVVVGQREGRRFEVVTKVSGKKGTKDRQ